LDINGLNGEWKNGVPMSDWEGPMGDMDFEGLNDGVAHTIARLSKNLNPRNYDSPGLGPGNDLVGEAYDFCKSDSEEGNEGEDTSTSLKINSLSLLFFSLSIGDTFCYLV